jgi:hypothetical protein
MHMLYFRFLVEEIKLKFDFGLRRGAREWGEGGNNYKYVYRG